MSGQLKADDERIFKLSRPFVFEENEYTVLTLDFERLTGEDMINAERAYKADNPGAGVEFMKEVSKGYLTYIVASAASVPIELIKKLPAKDFTSITMRAQGFLLL